MSYCQRLLLNLFKRIRKRSLVDLTLKKSVFMQYPQFYNILSRLYVFTVE